MTNLYHFAVTRQERNNTISRCQKSLHTNNNPIFHPPIPTKRISNYGNVVLAKQRTMTQKSDSKKKIVLVLPYMYIVQKKQVLFQFSIVRPAASWPSFLFGHELVNAM